MIIAGFVLMFGHPATEYTHVRAAGVLCAILRALAIKGCPETLVATKLARDLSESERHLVRETAKRLAEVVALEQNENQVFTENCTND